MSSEALLSSQRVTRSALMWTLLAQSLCILPLFFYLPLWLPVVWLFCSIWRVQIYRGHWPYPKTFMKTMLGAACIAGLIVSYKGSFGVAPVVGFLICSFLLKLLEAKNKKDVTIVLYVSFIAVGAQLLFNQTIFAALYGLVSFAFIVAAFSAVFGLSQQRARQRVFLGMKLTLQALPLAIMLFLVLPRLGQLWAVPVNNASAKTGFSESMAPGDFSELIKSNEVVFRAEFSLPNNGGAAPIPEPSSRYWRGLVLDYFDGRSWNRGPHRRFSDYSASRSSVPREESELEVEALDYEYSIMMEPHQRRWLFTMMAPVNLVDSTVDMGFKQQVLLASRVPVSQRIKYTLNSSLNYRYAAQGLGSESQIRALQLPNTGNNRTRELVSRWVDSGQSKAQIIESALSLFRNKFTYTLRPPALGADTIDEFLFITQRGFCEHFSSSFTYMMRLAEIPARVVVGYQGGELNELENYLVVRQRDAHAWTEVWLEGEGWVRIDPTHAVAPSRIEMGIQGGVDETEAAELPTGFSVGVLSRLQMRWDSISYLWYSQVLAYDNDSQKSFFEKYLGGTDYWRIALALFGGCLIFLVLYFFIPQIQVTSSTPKHIQLINKFENRLAKYGFQRQRHQSLAAFASEVAKVNPQHRVQLDKVVVQFNALAYGGQQKVLEDLAKSVSNFPYRQLNSKG